MDNQHSSSPYHGSYKAYIIGFVLSVILTVIPFAMVMNDMASKQTILWSILVMAVVQVLVHLYYFLHLDTSPTQRWNMMTFVYTIVVVGTVIVGSIWIIINMHANMLIH